MAIFTFEAETDLTGAWTKGDASVGEGPGYESVKANGLFALLQERKLGCKSTWERFDLLAGLDAKARHIVECNLFEFIGIDAASEALADAE